MNGIKDKEQFAEENMKLVKCIANKFSKRYEYYYFDYDELYSIGLVVYNICINKFDFNRNCKFSTYFYKAFKNEIQDHFTLYTRRENIINRVTCDFDDILRSHTSKNNNHIREYICNIYNQEDKNFLIDIYENKYSYIHMMDKYSLTKRQYYYKLTRLLKHIKKSINYENV